MRSIPYGVEKYSFLHISNAEIFIYLLQYLWVEYIPSNGNANKENDPCRAEHFFLLKKVSP